MDPDEDAKNKADRPLPARRISLPHAVLFRWLTVPACWALSALYSAQTFYASVALVALTVIYNELAAHKRHWAIRNLVNALGFAAFEAGATLVAGEEALLSCATGLRVYGVIQCPTLTCGVRF